MAVIAIGSMFGGKKEMLDCFIRNNIVALGYGEEANYGHNLLKSISPGEIVIVKANPFKGDDKGLQIKAIGICSYGGMSYCHELGFEGKPVEWVWIGNYNFGVIDDKAYNMRLGSIYVEYNDLVIRKIIEFIREK